MQRKNLYVNATNLHVNYSNNLLLRGQLSLTQESVSQLSLINEQLSQLNEIIAKKTSQEERENFTRELIYNIKKVDSALAVNTDKTFVSFEARSLIYLIESNHISTASFTQIQDKEYFEEILNNLKQKADDISPEDQKDLEGFFSIYQYALSLIDEYKAERHFKAVNVPDNFDMVKEEPICDPILNCEKEFEDEIDNKYTTLSMFSKNLRSYISSTEQLPDFFDKYFQIKKDYELNHLKWFMYKALIDAHTNQDKLDNIVLKIQCCTSLINKYLDMHPDLKKDYPKIPFDVETENIDFNEITKEYELKYQKKERELNDYYNTIVNRLNNKLQNNDISKKKKRGFSFFKKK
ncbi:MAG: hypothetical protein MSL09_03825 [Spirochaetia bacterium]|nr:hypothetical protein [Spirochaetia bacterium]